MPTQYFAFVCLLFSCGNAGSSEYVIGEVSAMLNNYHEAIEKYGLEAELDYLDDSHEFFWVPPGYRTALDFDSVAAVLRVTDPSISAIQIHWDSLKIIPLRDDLAQFYGTITMQTTDTTGTITTGHLVETGLVIKRSDGWKLLNGQSAFFESL
ncbi:MAG: hypothetical protein E2O88_08645 [Bacteroidetes bacterium]|nr:MAG: hypothetical protein E2O88_08645 [Bacteroidota bacterium]